MIEDTCMRRQHTSSGWMAAITVTAAPPAMMPRSAGPGVTPSFSCRNMDRPVSYEANPSPFDTVLLICIGTSQLAVRSLHCNEAPGLR